MRFASCSVNCSTSFFLHVFSFHPELRPLFTGDIERQGIMFMKVVSMAVNSLYDMDSILPALRELGKRHIEYGVQPHHYAAIRESFIWILKRELAEGFTEEVEQAWGCVFDLIAVNMMGNEMEHDKASTSSD
ncbi:hemin receptor [Paraneptunicella aestuarii]|nr:globin domain-containing protein [Paraneptunicella aestuarii]UAA37680.1 hemin receptor [Paraneptunicella aestuarii]